MKHFLIEIEYTTPMEQIEPIVPEHRAYIQLGFDSGMLLYSGPMVPRTGGIVLARAETIEAVETFLSRDPYRLQGVATHRIVEFTQVKYQPFLSDWV